LGDRPQFFYSRRIGQPPQGDAPGDYVDMPSNSTILGAAKLSGRRANGWSIGVLEALTAREWATVAFDSAPARRQRDEVEPLTNYFVGRLKRDLRQGNTTLGLVATAVNRDLDTPALDMLGSAAYAGGVDLFHRWGHKTYTLAASLGGSYTRGSPLAIQEAQHSSARYYGRPDAKSFHYDSLRTSLAGITGDAYLNRVGGAWTASDAGGATDDRLTRGGPLARTPPSWYVSADAYTDDRKMASLYGFAALTHDTAGGWSLELLPKLTLRPSSAVSLGLAPEYLVGRTAAQYVTTVSDTFAKNTFLARYVFAQLMQHQLSATLHFNATFS